MTARPEFAADFFVLRTPLLPLSAFLDWGDGADERDPLRERLAQAFDRPELRDALFVASPDLEASLELWRRRPASRRGRAIELALARYFARLCGRPTPFGLFAGCTTGAFGASTHIELEPRESYRRHSRLDLDYLDRLTHELARDPRLANRLSYRPNSSLYRAGGRLRYVESRYAAGERTYHVVAVRETRPLRTLLERAAGGASRAELAAALAGGPVSVARADEFVRESIESQVLVADLALAVTGDEALGPLLHDLRTVRAADPADTLERAGLALASIDGARLGELAERYRAVAAGLPGTPDLRRAFQVDLLKPARAATLGPAVVRELERGIHLLQRLVRRGEDEIMAHFRERFVERYHAQEVPLVEALDSEVGIGFGPARPEAGDAAPLLRDLAFPTGRQSRVDWGPREDFLLARLTDAVQRGSDEIALEADDVDRLTVEDAPPLPDAFAVVATLAATSSAACDRGDFRVLMRAVDGPPGARLLGRFCHADRALRERVADHVRAEAEHDPNALYAEIVHLPEGRIGNVLLRPVLREYELPYLGRSGAPADRQLPITDLLVSVADGRIELRSAALGRRVIPRLTTAHNFRLSPLPIYRFLCLLQGRVWIGWNWGALEAAPFLPRVRAGRVVLALAGWRLGEDELRLLGRASSSEVRAWRSERGLPRLVVLADGESALPVDLDNPLSVDSLAHLVRGRSTAVLEEAFPPPDELCVRSPEGGFVHELVVPFVARAPARTPAAPAHARTPTHIRRTFLPGSEWLYAKLYTGSVTADQLLRDDVRPLVAEAVSSSAADAWFFVRIGDPDWHLRLRLRGRPDVLVSEVEPVVRACASRLLADGLIRRLQLDTYERELERYGGPHGIELSEAIFHADSDAVLAVLAALPAGDRALEQRWLLALQGIHLLLSDLTRDDEAARRVTGRLRESFRAEFRVDSTLAGQLGDRFRAKRRAIEEIVDGPPHAAFARRSELLAPLVERLVELERVGALTRSVEELAESYLHMHLNRMLRSAQRRHELVLYDFLARVYESRAARMRSAGRPLVS